MTLLNHISRIFQVEIFHIIQPMFPATSQALPGNEFNWRSVKPQDWTWEEFQKHLSESRAAVDDYEWVRRARIAVRKHSEAAWERVGTILGCDGDLLSAGEDYGVFSAGGPLEDFAAEDEEEADTPAMYADDSYGFLGDSQGRGQVSVEGLAPTDADDDSFSLDRGIREEDHEDHSPTSARPVSPSPGRSISPFMQPMEAVGESDQEQSDGRLRRASHRKEMSQGDIGDMTETPTSMHFDVNKPRDRTKSFVGLQISTKPSLPVDPNEFQRPSSTSFFPPSLAHQPHLERGPGNPLFPTSFSRLSLAPTLPNNNPMLKLERMSFNATIGNNPGMPDVPRTSVPTTGSVGRNWMGLGRRKSGGGWSRVSESESKNHLFSHQHPLTTVLMISQAP